MPWLMAGCVVPDPEKFREPKSTAPVFDVPGANPPVNRILEVAQNDRRSFNIPYRSEDNAGDPPAAIMYLNFNTPKQRKLTGDTFEKVSTFDDTSRSFGLDIEFTMPCEVPPPADVPADNVACCQQLTLLATHESKLVVSDAGTEEVDIEIAGQDLAMLVWFVAVSPDVPFRNVVGKCLTPTTPETGDR
jgi:hypothetical protein